MKRDKISAFLKKAMNRMFEDIGEVYCESFIAKEGWYTTRSWDASQENKFHKWFVTNARKDLKWTKNIAEKEYGWFNLMWGWKRNDWSTS